MAAERLLADYEWRVRRENVLVSRPKVLYILSRMSAESGKNEKT